MEAGTGNWEDFGSEDLQELEARVYDPLAELAVDLAICCLAAEQGIGGPCDDCTCQLKYHVTVQEGQFKDECETCGCYERRQRPYAPLTRIPSRGYKASRSDSSYRLEMYPGKGKAERAYEARQALKELTE